MVCIFISKETEQQNSTDLDSVAGYEILHVQNIQYNCHDSKSYPRRD